MFRIALLDDYQSVAMRLADWSSLGSDVEVTAFSERVEDVDALVETLRPFHCVMAMRERTQFSREVISRLTNLRLIVSAAMWNVAIDLDAASEHGVQVCGTGDQSTATPELAIGMMLSLVRQIHLESRAIRAGKWQTELGTSVSGKVLGVLGLGDLGSKVAALGQAFGMRTIAWSSNLRSERAASLGVTYVDKDTLFAESDVLTIHLKLSERTRGLVGERELRLMKPSAYLINTSRGPIVDEAALITALREDRLAGAGLDVFDYEPLPQDHPLRTMDNVLLTPHIGFVTEENYRVFYGDALEDIRAFIAGDLLRPMNRLR